jgi:ATP-dependent Clp protease protease subunit
MHNNTLIPIVVEKDANGYERSYDIYSRLLKDFIIFVTGPIDLAVANTFIAQVLFLESQDDKRNISVYINTPGGEVHAGMAMYDTLKYVKNPVTTINVGLAASMGSILMCAGSKGSRFCLPNSFILIHQNLGGIEGQTSDVDIYAKQMLKVRNQLAGVLSDASGKDIEIIKRDMDRDNWMDAQQSLDYGLIDKIYEPEKK